MISIYPANKSNFYYIKAIYNNLLIILPLGSLLVLSTRYNRVQRSRTLLYALVVPKAKIPLTG